MNNRIKNINKMKKLKNKHTVNNKNQKNKLIFIPNSFVKTDEYIADIIMSAKNKSSTIQHHCLMAFRALNVI